MHSDTMGMACSTIGKIRNASKVSVDKHQKLKFHLGNGGVEARKYVN
jgi:hypothetical protein